jgi:hypothetical protein
MTKPRKPLGDALAQQFVYGQDSSQKTSDDLAIQPLSSLTEDKSTKETDLMSKILKIETKEATVRLTVDLSETMHRKLSLLSARTSKKKAVIVRMLLEEALEGVND